MPQSRVDWFREQLRKFDRIAVTGVPGSGKTTLCKAATSRPSTVIMCTDEFKDMPWSESSAMVAKKANETVRNFVIEGVAVPRALRKGMEVDAVIVLSRVVNGHLTGLLKPLSSGQIGMGKSVHRVLDEWHKENPNVPVLYAPPAAKDWSEYFYEKEKNEE